MPGFAWSVPLSFVFDSEETEAITAIDFISKDLIRITFLASLVVDDAYLNPESYTITALSDGAREVTPVSVLMQRDSSGEVKITSTTQVYLSITAATPGATYVVDVQPSSTLRYVDGTNPAQALTPRKFMVRHTKTDQILKSLPKHFDKRAVSEVRTLLTAISMQDDLIGGSRRDDFDV